jgi:membrane protein required for colicin V production
LIRGLILAKSSKLSYHFETSQEKQKEPPGPLRMSIATVVDLLVIFVLLISAGVSFFRGFIREVLTIFGVIGGLLAALFFGAMVQPLTDSWFGVEEGKDAGKFFDLIPYSVAADATAYGGIFLSVFIILQLISHFLSSAVQALGLGPVDRTLGVFFGIARGVVLLAILYLPFHLVLSDEQKKLWFKDSKTLFYVESLSKVLAGYLPETGDDKKGDEKKEDTDTREKLKSLDVLDDGKKKDDQESNPETEGGDAADGYDSKERQILDSLIEKKIPVPIGGFNE